MIDCYLDKIFCPFWEQCKNGWSCDKAMTKEVRGEMIRSDAPYASFFEKPSCFNQRGINDENDNSTI